MARRLFGTTEEVVGRSFSLNYIDYRVCGVVRSASYLTSKSYAQLYIPYTVSPDYSTPKYDLPYLGAFSATFQELERIYLEKSRVCQLYHNRKITAAVGRLYITVFRQIIMQLGRNDKGILYGIEPVLQCLVGNSPLHGPGIVAASLREF